MQLIKDFFKKESKEEIQETIKLSQLTVHKLDWLEYLTMGLAVWFFFYPKPYILLFSVLLVIPILGIVLNGIHKPSFASLVDISLDKKENLKYDVADFIDVAAWVILIRVLIDYKFENYYSLIIPAIVSLIIVFTLLFSTHKKIEKSNRNKAWIYTSVIFNVSVYSIAATYGMNCTYDFSKPKVFQTKILEKTIETGRKGRKFYNIEIAPWGHHFDKEELSVSRTEYDNYSIGETVEVDLKEGFLGIPWFYVEKSKNSY